MGAHSAHSARPTFGSRRGSNPPQLSRNSGHSVGNSCCRATTTKHKGTTTTQHDHDHNHDAAQHCAQPDTACHTHADHGSHQTIMDINIPPGLNLDDVNISIKGSTHTVAGGRRIVDCDPRTTSTTKLIRSFYHAAILPSGADVSAVTASVADSVLTVTIPKVAAPALAGFIPMRAALQSQLSFELGVTYVACTLLFFFCCIYS